MRWLVDRARSSLADLLVPEERNAECTDITLRFVSIATAPDAEQAPSVAGTMAVDFLSALPNEILARVGAFLDPLSRCRLRETGSARMARSCLDPGWGTLPLSAETTSLWAPMWLHWLAARDGTTETSLDHARCVDAMRGHAQGELAFYLSVAPLVEALQKLDSSRDRAVLAACVGRFPSASVARAVARRRPAALWGVIIFDIETGRRFREHAPNYRRSVSFMISPRVDGEGAVIGASAAAARPPIIGAPGFLGYAVDLLELRGLEERDALPALEALCYRDLTVWTTLADVRAAIASGAYCSPDPFFCCVDDPRPALVVVDDDAPRLIAGAERPRGGEGGNFHHFIEPAFAPAWKEFRALDLGELRVVENIARLRRRISAMDKWLSMAVQSRV